MFNRHIRAASTNDTERPLIEPRDSGTTLDPREARSRAHSRGRSRDSSRSTVPGEPVVHHHGTMTTTVGFREVCRAIRASAFKKNPLPIIVSLEVGAESQQQKVMVQIMKEEWDGLLLDKPLDGCDPAQRQPTLQELHHKILIKVKRQATDDCLTEAEAERGQSSPQVEGTRGGKPPICEELAALGIYTHSEHFEEHKLGTRSASRIFSLSEPAFSDLLKDSDKSRSILEHNRYCFMRIYPNPFTRFNSSNPNPSFHWRRGVQMVAMNWQNSDKGMMINDAMFADTRGWVLKPRGYRSDDCEIDVDAIPRKTLDLRISVLAGQFLPLSETRRMSGVGFGGDRKYRPQVKVELHVEKPNRSAENNSKETAPGETENPDWGHDVAPFEFLDVKNVVEELSFLR